MQRSPQSDLIWLPIASIGGAIVAQMGSIVPLLVWIDSMIFHELGHAMAFWLCSQLAVPSFGATLALHNGSSIIVFLGFSAAGYWAWRSANQAKYFFIARFFIVAAPVLFICTFLLSDGIKSQFILLAGQGGEFVIPSVLMIFFYYPMPNRFNWSKNRFIFLGLAAVCFSSATFRWHGAQSDAALVPMGSLFDLGTLLGDESESNGDIDRLINEFGWSSAELITFYVRLSLVCIAAVIIFYFQLVRRVMIPYSSNV